MRSENYIFVVLRSYAYCNRGIINFTTENVPLATKETKASKAKYQNTTKQ